MVIYTPAVVRHAIALAPDPEVLFVLQRSEMRTTHITLITLLLISTGSWVAAQSSPKNSPERPSQAPSQTAPGQTSPESQAAPPQAQAPSQADDQNPLNLTEEQKTKLRPIL